MDGKPKAEALAKAAPELSPEHCSEFLSRLPDRYFAGRDFEDIVRDAVFLAEISEGARYRLEYHSLPDNRVGSSAVPSVCYFARRLRTSGADR